MKLIAPGSSRRETVKLRPLTLWLVLAITVLLGSGCEEELAPQITQFVLDPDCEVMRQHNEPDPRTGENVYLTVQYFARASGGNRFDDPTGTNSALEFNWTFGDGSSVKNRVSGFHNYTAPGTYTVRLVVKDKDGDEASIEGEVFVGDFGTELDVLSIGAESGYSTLAVENRLRGQVAVIDVSNPSNPAVVGGPVTLTLLSEGTQQIAASDAAIAGDQLLVAMGNRGLRRLDLNTLTLAQSQFDVPGPGPDPDTVNGITIEGTTAYLALSDGLMRRLDVSNPTNPVFVAGDIVVSEQDDNPGNGQDVMTDGTYAYLANLDGLKTIKLADLSDSLVTGFDGSPGPALGVAVANDNAYIADGGVGLGVYDVSNPLNPMRVEWLGTDGQVVNIATRGDRGYVCDDTGGFYVISTTTHAPTVLGYTNTPGAATDVSLVGNHAYVANSGGLQIIDISDDANPTIVGSVLTLGRAVAAVHDGGSRVYVVYNGNSVGWSTPMEGTLTTPCPSSNLVQEFEWVWDFGDGSDPLTHSANPSHVYAPTPGLVDYWVKLRVTERQTNISRFDSLLVTVPNF